VVVVGEHFGGDSLAFLLGERRSVDALVPRPVSFHERVDGDSVTKEAVPGVVAVRVVAVVPGLNRGMLVPRFQMDDVFCKLVEHEARERRRKDSTNVSLDLAAAQLDARVLVRAQHRGDAERRRRSDAPGRRLHVGQCVDVLLQGVDRGRVGRCVDVLLEERFQRHTVGTHAADGERRLLSGRGRGDAAVIEHVCLGLNRHRASGLLRRDESERRGEETDGIRPVLIRPVAVEEERL